MDFWIALFAFIPAIFSVVIIHELGHYTAARICGVKVLRFSIGMGKILYRKKFRQDGTEWALSLLPLGGYVKLLDARNEDMKSYPADAMAQEFTSRNVWQRVFIVAAGPIANFILAVVVLFVLYIYGVPRPSAQIRVVPVNTAAYQVGLRGGETIVAIGEHSIRCWDDVKQVFADTVAKKRQSVNIKWMQGNGKENTANIALEQAIKQEGEANFLTPLGLMRAQPPAILDKLEKGGAAERAGLYPGDKIIAVNGVSISDALALIELIRKSPNKDLCFTVERKGQLLKLNVHSESQEKDAAIIGKIGVKINVTPDLVNIRYDVVSAFKQSIEDVITMISLTVQSIGQMISGHLSIKNVTGPITIADYAGKTAREGGISYLSFIVFISISIGMMNLLPIPVLDGGLLLYYAVEIIKGSPVSERMSKIGTVIGLGVLGFLMIVAMCNDFGRLFS